MAMPRRSAGQSAPAQGRWLVTTFSALKASWQSMCDEMQRFHRSCLSVLIPGNASPMGESEESGLTPLKVRNILTKARSVLPTPI